MLVGIAGLAALCLSLLGCGGGGDDVSRGTHDMLQEELDAALALLMETETERDTAEAEATRLTGELSTANASATSLTAQLETANGSVTSLTADLATAQAEVTRLTNQVGSVADPTSLQGLLAAANADVARLTAQLVTASAQVTTLTSQLTSSRAEVTRLQVRLDAALDRAEGAEDDLEDAETAADVADRQTGQLQSQLSEAQQAELNARATAYITAINTGGGTDPREDVTVSYQRGSTLMINPGGSFDTGSGAPSISGFTARPYTRQVGVSGEETVYLYTNIQAPGTRAFWKEHGLEVMNATGNTAENPTPTSALRTAMDESMTTVSGRYDGVSGTFTCTGVCTGVVFVQGESGARKFTGSSTWDFEPSSITSPVRQMMDTEYLYFGIWVQEPNVASAAHNYEYIMGGSPPFTSVEDLSGTAQFRGGAIGKYVTRNQVGENAKIGTFTAEANFTATFVTGPTLEGRITNFRDGGQTLTGWNVYLGDAMDDPAQFNSGTGTGTASALIGGIPARGEWDATLHGTPNDNLEGNDNNRDSTMYPVTRYPLADLAGLVGNFHASSTSTITVGGTSLPTAAIAGAFGATPR